MTVATQPEGGKKQATLSRELSEFLIGLSIAVHRFAMYPGDHPSLAPAAEKVITALADLLQARPALALGVAQKQLMVEGVATDERHPVLSDLARRLHSHQLGALSFTSGTTLQEIEQLLRTLSVEPERGGRPLGLLPEETRPTWEHVKLLSVGYERLELKDSRVTGGDRAKSQQLWLGLARAALEDEGLDLDDLPDGGALAGVIQARGGDSKYEQVIVSYLLQMAEELRGGEGADAAEIREKMSELIRELDEDTIKRMIELGGARSDRTRFVRDASQGGLAVDTVVKVLQAAAEADGQSISSSLTRLLAKLSALSGDGANTLRAEAESAVREHVESLISDWELDDPNPDAYTQILDGMARAAPALSVQLDEEREVPGSERVIQMALESDAFGATVQKAVTELIDQGGVGRLIELLDAAPEGSQVADRLRSHLMTPVQLKRMLAGDDVDEDNLRILVDRLGSHAIDPLFQYLTESESRAVRRKIFDTLVRLGDSIADVAVTRLRDERWFVKRNILALFQRLENLPEGLSLLPYLQHPDARVRREAFLVSFRMPTIRERGIASAMADTDERVVRMALLEVQEELPETVVPVVVGRVLESESLRPLRSLAVRALGNSGSALALETLLNVSSRGRTLLGKPRLAPKSPELLAALSALAGGWRSEPRAKGILAVAERSKDLQVQAASQGGGNAG